MPPTETRVSVLDALILGYTADSNLGLIKGVGTGSPLPLFDSTNGEMTQNEVIRGHKKFGPK